jgi:hypothetical protein
MKNSNALYGQFKLIFSNYNIVIVIISKFGQKNLQIGVETYFCP